jgi:hypothetical protein
VQKLRARLQLSDRIDHGNVSSLTSQARSVWPEKVTLQG